MLSKVNGRSNKTRPRIANNFIKFSIICIFYIMIVIYSYIISDITVSFFTNCFLLERKTFLILVYSLLMNTTIAHFSDDKWDGVNLSNATSIAHSIIILSIRWMIYMSDTCFIIITVGFFDEIKVSLRTKYYFCSLRVMSNLGSCAFVGQVLVTNSLSKGRWWQTWVVKNY